MTNARNRLVAVFTTALLFTLLFTLVQTIMPNSIMPGQAAWAAKKVVTITYYVAPSGNDNAAGTENAPFKTIAKAAKVVSPGGTVIVRGGTYSGQVTFSRSGTNRHISLSKRPKVSIRR